MNPFNLQERMYQNNHTIIFIPGFRGSTLVNQRGQLVWPNVIKAQFDHTISLCDNRPTLDMENPNLYKSTEIIQSVTLVPGLITLDIYGKFIQALRKNVSPDTNLILFHYDWRQDLPITITQLKQVIHKTPGSIDIVCHSMGGLITSRLLQIIDTKNIRYVFFVGVPFQGALATVRDFKYGCRIGINHSLFSPKAMSSFESAYYLLARYPDAIQNHNLFDIETWQKFKLGYLVTKNDKRQLDFLNCQLQKVNHFYDKLETDKSPLRSKTKLMFIKSTSYATPTHVIFEPKLEIISGSGDGTVPLVSLQVPSYLKSFDHEIHAIHRSHAYSFTSDQLVNLILTKLTDVSGYMP
jgi:pimeloyl-ACP methyl ester carboxylesterase